MANVKVEEQSLVNIADALRDKLGNTKTIYVPGSVPIVKVSKSPNATGFDTHNDYYQGNATDKDTIQIPGATKIEVDIAYQTEGTSYDWVQVYSGSGSPSGERYGGHTLTRKTLTFENTDTVSFYWRTDNGSNDYLGYYAEIKGYDADGNVVEEETQIPQEVPNVFKPADMGPAISKLNGPIGVIKNIYPEGTRGKWFSFRLPKDVDYKTTKFVFIMKSYPSANSGNGFTFISTWDPEAVAFSAPEWIGGSLSQFSNDGQPKLTMYTNGTMEVEFATNQYTYNSSDKETIWMFIY